MKSIFINPQSMEIAIVEEITGVVADRPMERGNRVLIYRFSSSWLAPKDKQIAEFMRTRGFAEL